MPEILRTNRVCLTTADLCGGEVTAVYLIHEYKEEKVTK